MPKRAVLYARVSGDDTRNEGRNLESQLEMCREYATSRGWKVVAELAEDDRGASGADHNLPQLNKMLEMAKEGVFDILVVRELDRLSRKLAKQLLVEDKLKAADIQIEYVLGEYPDTPEGNLNKNIKAVIAEYERLKVAERTHRGRRRKVKEGNVMMQGQAPFGYRIVEQDGMRTIEIVEEEAKIVHLIYTLYIEGDARSGPMGLAKIAGKLTDMGIPTPADKNISRSYTKRQGWAKWNKQTVNNILTRETYAGVWHYGKYTCKDGNWIQNPKEHWIPVDVPAIVDRDVWDKAQKQRKRNLQNSKRNLKYKYLLRRRATCHHCGLKMQVTNNRSKSGKTYLYYRCAASDSARDLATTCDKHPYFNAIYADATIWKWLQNLLMNPEILRKGLEAFRSDREEQKEPLRKRMEVLEEQLAEAQDKLDRLIDLYLSGEFSKERLSNRKSQLEERITELEGEHDTLLDRFEEQALTIQQIERIEAFAEKVSEGIKGSQDDFQTRRRIIELLDVRARLAVEDDEKVVYAQWPLGEVALDPDTGKPAAFPSRVAASIESGSSLLSMSTSTSDR